MSILFSQSSDVAYNLAVEEYLLRYYPLEEDILYLWQGSKAFVFGRNQNPFIEIHPTYLLDDSIPKIRRVSGGGTIYEDQGTINFSYITKNYKDKINDYEYFLNPIIRLMSDLGLNIHFKPKSHLFIDEFKISGNAQAFINNRLLHHGTILFNTDLRIIEESLINHSQSVTGHQVLSNKQSVINVGGLIQQNQIEFTKMLADYICFDKKMKIILLDDIDEWKVKEIVESKYKTWEWNFGQTPKFKTSEMIEGSLVEISVQKGLVTGVDKVHAEHLIGLKYFSKEYRRNKQKGT